MARDATELAGVYRNAARDQFIVASSGTLLVESGGVATIASGGILNNKGTITSTGANTIASGGTMTVNSGATLALKGTMSSTHCHMSILDSTVTFTGTLNLNGTTNLKGTLGTTGAVTFSKSVTVGAAATMLLTTGATVTFGANIANKGTITNSSDGQIRESVQSAVAAVALNAYGVSVIGSSSASARTYTLARPAGAGIRKTIICKGSTGACLVRCSSLAKLNYGTNRKITFSVNADGYGVELLATSSTNWQTIRNSTAQVTTIAFGAS